MYSDTAHHQRYDWAFIHVHPSAYELPIEAVTGGLALDFNPARGQSWTVYGYPQGSVLSQTPPVAASSFVQCGGKDATTPGSLLPAPPGPPTLFIAPPSCDKDVGGASGGPWVNSQGEIGGVSKAQQAGTGIIASYLDNAAAKAYAGATA